MKILIIVTGDMENIALHKSLSKTFEPVAPGHLWQPRMIGGGALTTSVLRDPSTHPITPKSVTKLANAMVSETLSNAWDLVIGIDDLELANAAQPEIVINWVKRGIAESINTKFTDPNARIRAETKLRNFCSFHLFAPLPEAYFFSDRAALTASGVPSRSRLYLRNSDQEDFETNNPGYLPQALVKNREMIDLGHNWYRHERHPKRYLEFLVYRQSADKNYRETVEGADALKILDWTKPGSTPDNIKFARALFQDLADFLGICNNPIGPGIPCHLTYPSRFLHEQYRTLRNF